LQRALVVGLWHETIFVEIFDVKMLKNKNEVIFFKKAKALTSSNGSVDTRKNSD